MKSQASKTNNYHYNPKLKDHARELRNNSTKAEACLWKYVLRAGNLKGYKFRRQRPILNYIVDFVCFELMLIIEVDGITHWHESQVNYDNKRTKELESVGFKIIRFNDEEVLNDIENVVRVL